jgi:neutral ceramidase
MVLSLTIFASLALAQEIDAGVARVDITPAVSMPMYGYANRKCGPSIGTHDALAAKVLILRAGDTQLGIVTADLGSLVSARLHQEAARRGIKPLLLAASHSHSTPAFIPPSVTAEQGAPYQREVEDKILGALDAAQKSLFPARLGVGRGQIQAGYNRLVKREDGRARALFDNLERLPLGPVDPEFMILRVDDRAGNPKAVLVHYAVHSVVLGPTNCKFSADYPGVLQARVESALEGAQAMFVQGAAGDINPLFMARSGRDEEDFAVVAKLGEWIAGSVIPVARAIRTEGWQGPIRHTTETLRFVERWDKTKPVEVGLSTILVGKDMAIAAMPGEPLHRLQTRWKQEADVPHAFFYGYTDSTGVLWPGYLPDLRSAAYGGYGADVTTRIEVGAGERIVGQHLIHLYGLRGMWLPQPGKP